MRSTDLTTAQAKRVYDTLWPTWNYLLRLERRMGRVGFDPDDRLYGLVVKAHNAMFELAAETQRLGCPGGVGFGDRK